MGNWGSFLTGMALVLVRVSALLAFAPFFSLSSLTVRSRVALAVTIAYLLAPLVATLPGAHLHLDAASVLSELSVGLVYGLVLALLNEMLVFAGQIMGMQLSFSLVNLLDPNSSIQTPLLGELFQLLGALVVITGGLDRILLASLVRSFHAVPLGGFVLSQPASLAIVKALSGVFLAALELAAPVLTATMLVELAISLLGKISPQLPVMNLTVPIKTMTGFALLTGSLALWPRFIGARFASLLDLAERLLGGRG